ncbi:MAG: hypothetical protein ACRDG7_06385 [Candidatus Limnocylindria bacterium]
MALHATVSATTLLEPILAALDEHRRIGQGEVLGAVADPTDGGCRSGIPQGE